jgi:hypothetical protein
MRVPCIREWADRRRERRRNAEVLRVAKVKGRNIKI